jgi:hypothetical protein
MPDYADTFTVVEFERLLDWFRGLRLCHGDVPRDYEFANKIALELAKLRRRLNNRSRGRLARAPAGPRLSRIYFSALRLAPLALVQSVAASGIAVLALLQARGHPSRLARGEQ